MASAQISKASTRRPKSTPTATPRSNRPAVISNDTWLLINYKRFSSDKQKHGRSTDRQVEAFDQFVETIKRLHPDRHYVLHLLPMDRGLGALYGDHRKRGQLGKFLKGIESGSIKVIPGRTILFVEEVRRLTREGGQKALKDTLNTLFDAGITLTLAAGMEWSTELNAKTPGWLGTLITLLDLAYAESKQKSDWRTDDWEDKRKRARKSRELINGNVPYWLRIVGRDKIDDKVVKAGRPEIIPEAGKAIVKMFKLAAKGLGYNLIQQALQHDTDTKGGWVPKKRKNQKKRIWRRTYIQLTLRNRQVIGEFQLCRKRGGKFGKRESDGGEPIKDYYPNVLKDHPGLFELVQKKLASKQGASRPGPNPTVPTVLGGFAKCGYCGSALHSGNKGRGIKYLYCYESSGRKQACPMMRYETVETTLLDQLRRLKPEQVLPRKGKNKKLIDKLRQQEQEAVANIGGIEARTQNFIDSLGDESDKHLRDQIKARIAKSEKDKRDEEKRLTQIRTRLDEAQCDAESVKQWQNSLDELKQKLADGDLETRKNLNEHLGQFIDRVEVFPRGYPQKFLDGSTGEALTDYLHEFYSDPPRNEMTPRERQKLNTFRTFVEAQLRSKRARFIRVYFKEHGVVNDEGGDFLKYVHPYVDLIPEGSIAGDSKRIDDLWQDFRTSKRRTCV